MINKTAFMALSLIMVVSWAFGAVCDRMITRWYDEPCDKCSCGDNWEADK